MKEIKVTSYDLVDGKGFTYKGERAERFEDCQVRDSNLCTVCGKSAYPKCKEYCSVGINEKRRKSQA